MMMKIILKLKNNHIIINYIFRYLGIIFFSLPLYKYESLVIDDNSEENHKNEKFNSLLFITLIMIIMVLQEISEDIFYKSNLRVLDFLILQLPLLSFFNLKYFKIKIYLHHKLSIYFNLIICGIYKIIYLIFVINNDGNDSKEKSVFKYYNEYWGIIPLGIITYLIIMIGRAFALSEIKVLMQYKYYSPIKLLIIYGIIGTIITTIIGIISTFIECNKFYSSLALKICKIKDNTDITYLENFKIWWKDEINITNITNIILLIIGIIMNFLYRLFYFLTIKYLTAIHIIFSFIFYSYILGWIGNLIKNNNKNTAFIYVFILIMHLIISFGLLIYLEIIELDFCNLNYNLKKNIIERSIQDYELENDNDNEEDDLKD